MERGEREKKVMAALLVFMLTSLETVFERENCLTGELYFGCNFFKNPTRYIRFLTLAANRNLIKKIIYIHLKPMIK